MASQSGINNTIPDANFTVPNNNVYVGSNAPANPARISIEETVAGSTGISIQNPSGSTSSASVVQHIVEAGAGDAYSNYVINGGQNWSAGMDNSDSDSFKITTGSSPSAGTVVIKSDTSGNITTANSVTVTSGNITASAGALDINTGDVRLLIDSSLMNQTYYAGSNGTGVSARLRKNRSGGVITSGDIIGTKHFEGYDGTQYVNAGWIRVTSTGTIAANRVAGNMVLATHPDSASGTTPTTRMTIASTGAVTIAAPDSGTGLTISGGGSSTTGRADFANGLSFDAGTNTLSNFVATTAWTPVLKFGGTSTGITYGTQSGSYMRIGNAIVMHMIISLTSKGTDTGTATITGFPFTASFSLVPFAWRVSNLTFNNIPQFRIVGSTITCEDVSSAGAAAVLDDTDFANNSYIALSGVVLI